MSLTITEEKLLAKKVKGYPVLIDKTVNDYKEKCVWKYHYGNTICIKIKISSHTSSHTISMYYYFGFTFQNPSSRVMFITLEDGSGMWIPNIKKVLYRIFTF